MASCNSIIKSQTKLIVDENSFLELGEFIQTPHAEKKKARDGVITGLATIEGRKVAVYAQDFTFMGGSIGEKHAQSLTRSSILSIVCNETIILMK